MAYNVQPFNFKLTGKDYGAVDLADSLRKGFKGYQELHEAANTPKKLAEALYAQQLQNKINKPKAEHAEEITMADLEHTRAGTAGTETNTYAQKIRNQFLPESERERIEASKRSNNPLSHLTGAANDAYQLKVLKEQLGQDDPAVIEAQKQYDLEQESKRGLNSYRTQLAGSLDKRSSSAVGKLQIERQNAIDTGASPDTVNQYDLAIQKNVTDADNRKKVLLATNIDKTINQINPDDLTHYAGLKGEFDLKKEEINAVKGKESKQYRDYLKAVSNSEIFAHQVRQFYGDSIQPAMLAKLERLTNPGTWRNNPRIAKELYNSVVNTIKNETGTYRAGLKDTDVYTGEGNGAQGEKVGLYKDGVLHFIPIADVKEARNLGYKDE